MKGRQNIQGYPGEGPTLLQSVDAKTLALMEQELIRDGVSHEEIRESLCGIHLDIIKDSLVAKEWKSRRPTRCIPSCRNTNSSWLVWASWAAC